MKRTLPQHMHRKHGAYYYVSRVAGKVKWLRLSSEYGEALRKWAELEGGTSVQAWTIAQAIGHYLDVSAKRLQPSTLVGYEAAASHLLPVFGHMPVSELRKSHVYSYVVKRGNVAGNRERALLSVTYSHMAKAGIFDGVNPAAGLQFRNLEKVGTRYVTDSELSAIIGAAGHRMKLLVRFAYLTGMRQGDLLALKLSAAVPEGIFYKDSKTGKNHLIAWSDELRAIWKSAAGLRIGSVPVFLSQTGSAYTSSGFKASWRRVKIRAKLADIKFHDLRRKSGSDADDDAHAQALLGHADGKVTRKHYRAKLTSVQPIEPGNVRHKPNR